MTMNEKTYLNVQPIIDFLPAELLLVGASERQRTTMLR